MNFNGYYVITFGFSNYFNNCFDTLVVPLIQKWCKIAEEHSKKSRSYRVYYNGMGDRKSVISAYAYGMSRFMKFLKDNNDVSNVENFDKLLSFSTKKITAVLRDECRGFGLIVPPKDIWEWFGLRGKCFKIAF